jgi:hypothetical protein
MVQERDERPARLGDPDVCRSRLLAGVAQEIDESDPWIVERGHDDVGVVSAPVADDEDLPVVEALAAHALDRAAQRVAAVVRGDDDGDLRW